jgi:biopolymer transport protein ExbB
MTKLHRHPVLAPAVAVMLGFAGPAMATVLAMAQPTPAAPAPAASGAAAAPGAAPAAAAPTAGAPAAAPGTPAAPGTLPAPAGAPAPAANTSASASIPAAGSTGPAGIQAPQTAAVENPYGLDALWKGGDLIARGVLIILVIMSLGTWYIMITKFIEQARLLSAARAATKSFWNKPSVQDGAAALKRSSPFRFIADSGISATEHHEGTLTESIDLTTWVTMAIQRAVETIQSRLQGGLAFLATVGSTAPFVGLFGTVWGIYHALTAIGIAGQASIDKVAGPVGEALIMTAIGLATAVPAVLGYNFLVRRNKVAMERVRYFSSDLHSVLVGGVRISQPGAASQAPATASAGVTRVA